MYTVNSTETPCSQHEEFCITSLPEFLNDNVGVFQAAVVLSSISDKYGLNLLCYAIFPYQQFLLTLYDWHALSAGVVVGVVAAITFVVVWSSGYFVSLFSQKHGHGSGHVVHHNPVHVTHTTSEGHQSLLHPPTSSGGGHDHHRNTGAADYDSTFMLDKQLVSLLSCRDKLLEKVDLNVVETKAAFRAFCNTIEYGVRLTDQLPEYDTEFVASRMSVEPSRRKSLRLSISKRATDPVVTLFSRRAMSFLPTVLTAKKLSLSPPSFLHRLFPTNASRLATRVKAMGNSRASAGLDEDQLPMKIATYEASRQ